MPKIVGLTGGIGSGKSTVADFFKELGVPVYIADSEARKIMDYPEVIREVKSIFDENVTDTDNKLDRKKIASLVFNNPEKLKKLNAIVHPRVKEDFAYWLDKHKNHKYVIKEVAIIFETNSEKDFDKIILVTAPEKERIKRVMKRDNVSEREVLERMKNQLSDTDKISKSDFIIDNTNKIFAKKQAGNIHLSLNLA
ncbi:MAG: dephospho-CoA kinase [Flavobacteriaceae bacterium]